MTLALIVLVSFLVGLAFGITLEELGFRHGREWVWRRERDYWKENQ